jgi:6-phosphogluconate dehydrogenase
MAQIGLYGLAVMGQNFALNMASHGFSVSVCNRSPEKVDTTVQRAKDEGNLPLNGFKSPKEFVESLQKPRKVILLVQAGAAVDATIELLSQYMEPGDILVDGGNEWFPNSVRRAESLQSKGIMFMGMGISGGEEGARNGPSLMPGGPKEAYDALEPILTKCAAQVDDGACVTYVGSIGSGNYVKMIHNGIEYGDMELIGEIYDVLRTCAGCTNEDLALLFNEWNKGELESFLIEITANIMSKTDDKGPGYLVDKILDKTGMKGTGRWTVQEAAERSVAAPTMAAALDVRYLSARKEERVAASRVLSGPSEVPNVERGQIIADCKEALFCAKVCSYAQGMCVIQGASEQMDWGVNLSECARIWKGGCIIRAGFLDRIRSAFASDTNLKNLLMDPSFAAEMNRKQASWRRIVTLCIASGIGCPALSASLSYYDTYRRASLPANLTQAQRDYFGGHSFERIDMPGNYHARWTSAHKDIGDVGARNAGNV